MLEKVNQVLLLSVAVTKDQDHGNLWKINIFIQNNWNLSWQGGTAAINSHGSRSRRLRIDIFKSKYKTEIKQQVE